MGKLRFRLTFRNRAGARVTLRRILYGIVPLTIRAQRALGASHFVVTLEA